MADIFDTLTQSPQVERQPDIFDTVQKGVDIFDVVKMPAPKNDPDIFDTAKTQQQVADGTTLESFKDNFPELAPRIASMEAFGMAPGEIMAGLMNKEDRQTELQQPDTIDRVSKYVADQGISGLLPFDLAESTKAGFKRSASGILAGQGLTAEEVAELDARDPNALADFYEGLITLGVDIPLMGIAGVAGGAAGGPAGFATGPGAALAAPRFVQSIWQQYQDHKAQGGELSWGEFFDRSSMVAKDTGFSFLTGVLTGGAGKLASGVTKRAIDRAILTGTAEFFGLETGATIERTARQEGGAFQEKEIAPGVTVKELNIVMPTAQDIFHDAATLAALKLGTKSVTRLVEKTTHRNADMLDIVDEVHRAAKRKGKSAQDITAKEINSEIDISVPKNIDYFRNAAKERTRIANLDAEIASLDKLTKRTSSQTRDLTLKQGLKLAAERRLVSLDKEIQFLDKAETPGRLDQSGIDKFLLEEIKPPARPDLSPFDVRAVRDALVNGVNFGQMKEGSARTLNTILNKLDVTRPFRQIGADKTGFAVKNYYSERALVEERALNRITRNSKKFRYSKEELTQAAFDAEKTTAPKDPRRAAIYKELRAGYDEILTDLKGAEVLKAGFPDGRIAANKSIMAELQSRIANEKIPSIEKPALKSQFKRVQTETEALKKVKFVGILPRLFMDKINNTDPQRAGRIMRFLTQRQRKSISLQELVDRKLVDPSEVNAYELFGYYSRRAGKDIALGKLLKAAKADNLASEVPLPGFEKLPTELYPVLKNTYVHPQFSDFLSQYTSPRPYTFLDKTAATLKSASFYRPDVMPLNDVVQHSMAVVGDIISKPKNIAKVPGAYVRGIKSYIKKDANYWEAHANGLFSQPFNMPFDKFELYINKANARGGSQVMNALGKFTPKAAFKEVYNAIHSTAWAMDRAIRMTTYEYFKDGGMTPRAAGQMAALFHGDYARVDPNLRRSLNKVFYTPTFKIVMGHLYAEMMRSAPKMGKAILAGRAVSGVTRAAANGLVGTAVINIALDTFMNNMGFATEQFGRKYTKRVEDDRSIPQDLVMSFSTPANLPLKFAYRAFDAFKPGSPTTSLERFVRSNKFELSRPILILEQWYNNRKVNGEEIYDPFGDSAITQIGKISEFLITEAFPLLKVPKQDDTPSEKRAQKAVGQEIGRLFNFFTFNHAYLTDPKEIKAIKKAKSILNTLSAKERKRLKDEQTPMTPEQRNNYFKEVERVLKQ